MRFRWSGHVALLQRRKVPRKDLMEMLEGIRLFGRQCLVSDTYSPGLASVRFVVDKMTLGQVLLCHSHSTNAPYSLNYHRWNIVLADGSVVKHTHKGTVLKLRCSCRSKVDMSVK